MKQFLSLFGKIARYLLIVIVVSYGCTVSYWLLYPYNVIDVDYIKIMNPNKTVKQGGTLIYEISYTKYLDINGVVSRRLVNTYTISYSDMAGISPPGSRITHPHLPIPVYASPGKYRLLWTAKYQVNPMRYDIEKVWSDEFTVITDETKADNEKIDYNKQGEMEATKSTGKKKEKDWLNCPDVNTVYPGIKDVYGG